MITLCNLLPFVPYLFLQNDREANNSHNSHNYTIIICQVKQRKIYPEMCVDTKIKTLQHGFQKIFTSGSY